MGDQLFGRINHYQCPDCGQLTVVRLVDDGVTPFMLECRATAGCVGMATSAFFKGPQNPEQLPHVEWFKPTDAELSSYITDTLKRGDFINETPERKAAVGDAIRSHVQQGGLLPRELSRSNRWSEASAIRRH